MHAIRIRRLVAACAVLGWATVAGAATGAALGIPPVPVPADNPQTPAKIALGEQLFNDQRFSATGDVACSHCHDPQKGFADGPLVTAEGIGKLKGTRNSPTVLNAAYYASLFWDGRSPDLEDQALHPFVNPVEMGLPNHDPILAIVRTDPAYVAQFEAVFGKRGEDVTMREVTQAIASFERTLVSGDSPFDHYYFGGDRSALSAAAVRGFDVFLNKGRCVSCHTIEQDRALFTDNRFHNIGVGVNRIQADVGELAPRFLEAKATGVDVDRAVLTDPRVSELGRFAVTDTLDELGAFKTSTLRNIAITAPFMHDGSLATLRDVVDHYNNGGVTVATDPVNDFLSGGIRPLDLTEQEKTDLVAFLEALTSPQYAAQQAQKAALDPAACSTPTNKLAAAPAGDPAKGTQP